MILPLLNLILIVSIAVIGIASFLSPEKAIVPGTPDAPIGEPTATSKRQRTMMIVAIVAVAIFALLIWMGSGSLSGAAGGGSVAAPSLTAASFVFAAVAVMLFGVIALGLLLALILFVVVILKAPSRVRKIIAFSVSILTALLALSLASFYFDWGWNFPDILGTVGGILSLVFLINDRYLSK
jgi:hypothetical protein